jgi:hypothetical protein
MTWGEKNYYWQTDTAHENNEGYDCNGSALHDYGTIITGLSYGPGARFIGGARFMARADSFGRGRDPGAIWILGRACSLLDMLVALHRSLFLVILSLEPETETRDFHMTPQNKMIGNAVQCLR